MIHHKKTYDTYRALAATCAGKCKGLSKVEGLITDGEETVTILCNSGLVTQRSRQQLPRVSVLTSLSFGITEPLQSFSCGYLRLYNPYKVFWIFLQKSR